MIWLHDIVYARHQLPDLDAAGPSDPARQLSVWAPPMGADFMA